jgi:hypothetical protein
MGCCFGSGCSGSERGAWSRSGGAGARDACPTPTQQRQCASKEVGQWAAVAGSDWFACAYMTSTAATAAASTTAMVAATAAATATAAAAAAQLCSKCVGRRGDLVQKHGHGACYPRTLVFGAPGRLPR